MISMNQTTQNEHIRYHEEADDDLFIAEVSEHDKIKTSKHSMRRGEYSYCSLFKIESPNTPEQKLRMLLRRSYCMITNHILKNQYSTSFLLLKFHFHS
ncbi:hypothetical protein NC652_030318 [Populus alba x Populus x berolinensis]|nr:hypothetical protein NC652_030318 [Populus alba x Populus x berolinensis]